MSLLMRITSILAIAPCSLQKYFRVHLDGFGNGESLELCLVGSGPVRL